MVRMVADVSRLSPTTEGSILNNADCPARCQASSVGDGHAQSRPHGMADNRILITTILWR